MWRALESIERAAPLLFVLVLAIGGCPPTHYSGLFTNVTHYDLQHVDWKRTPNGIRVHGPADTYQKIDTAVDELERCLSTGGYVTSIRRDWFAVYIPDDWYVSQCSQEQLVPSTVDYRLCEQKGLTIPVACRQLERPTVACPCICNVRSTIQNNWIVVTAPNLKLFKMSLARIVLYPRYVLDDPKITKCLW